MTTTYEPAHPKYADEADVRGELTRVYDICNGCRACVDLCGAFPTLFDMIDRAGGDDAGRLTPIQQDAVVDECVHCNRCVTGCPYAPDRHEWNVDVPRLMLRATAMQYESGITTMRSKWALAVSGRTDQLGRLATSSSVVRALVGRRAGRLLDATLRKAHVGPSDPPDERRTVRFSRWIAHRRPSEPSVPAPMVTLLPTCVVEYGRPGVGEGLVETYQLAGIGCTLSAATCCGAPWLHAGAVDRFAKVARRNVELLAAEIRCGRDVVVAEPTCRGAIVRGYPDHVPTAEAMLVASHTFDAAEYLATPPNGAREAAEDTK